MRTSCFRYVYGPVLVLPSLDAGDEHLFRYVNRPHWLAVIPLLIAAYYAAYLYGFRFGAMGRAGAAVIGLALLLFLAVGFWFLARLPREVMLLFMGRSAAGTVLFAAGLVLTALAWMILKAKEAVSGASERGMRS